ncbi:MAG: hypothetical protein AB1758_12145, partial [Candidatus Eremiobacterota bacterium]
MKKLFAMAALVSLASTMLFLGGCGAPPEPSPTMTQPATSGGAATGGTAPTTTGGTTGAMTPAPPVTETPG